ncbi:sensor histidine kinase [Nocardioides marmoribigeumensis]|uniref:Oxygen sensor histidine kinase NreB n=1 Tax=Nocardioides marmoribigeumensis TaxID=433649 RepID=A0ABU2BTW0_9ACTN|nr:GAF domain-containing sensor histidine kinase [Nocardioides marmoribigeumensis]MDR7362063.1 signal transduction histidine kinase [Nocardioides marmoribigeumensis]
MPPLPTRLLPAAGAAAGVAAGVLGLVLHLGFADPPHAAGVTDWWPMGVVACLAFGPTGGWLASRRPEHPLGWLFLLLGLLEGVSLVATDYGLRALEHRWALAEAALWVGNWIWVLGLVPIASVVPLLVPDGHLPSRRWRPAFVLGCAAAVAAALGFAVQPYDATTPGLTDAGLTNPAHVAWLAGPVVGALLTTVTLVGVVLAVAGLVLRWRGSSGTERQQLKWVLVGVGAAVILFALGFALGPVVSALAMAPLPLAVVVAALRHGLGDVDVVISRSLVYVTLSGLVLVLYLALVSLLGTALGGLSSESTVVPLLSTAAVALGVLPLRDRLQRGVNRLVHGEEEEPYAVLGRLGDRLAAASTPESIEQEVLPVVTEQVARSLRAQSVVLRLSEGLVASHGFEVDNRTPTLTVPLVHAGEDLGSLAVHRVGGFDARAVRVLDHLASQVAVAARTVQLARESQRSRELAVLAREEERRRLRRDLHDGVGPSLAALALQVETARSLTGHDPEAAGRILDTLGPRLNGVVGEVRAMVNELRPPLLDELGLEAALRELVDRVTTATTRADLVVQSLPELPAAVEVAAYHIAREATANAVRHARASRVELRLGVADGMVQVEVRDDGSGLSPDRRSGVGLGSMRTRARELGGELLVDSSSRGTTVTAFLPGVSS